MRTRTIGALAAALWLAACSYDWDAYDPRLGDGPDASAGTTGSGGGAGASSGGAAGGGGSSAGGTSGNGGGGAGGGSGTGGASGDGGDGGSGGSAGGGGAAGSGSEMTVSYTPPEVSDCVSLTNPDPDQCESTSGAGVVAIDNLNNSLSGAPSAAFISFEVGNEIAGKQVLSVTLQLQATATSSAQSPSTGEVWEVTAFTRPDLFDAAPSKVGSSPLAPEQGMVASLQIVDWSLPTSVVSAGQMVYLGIFTSANDGVDYYSKQSPVPPKLIVKYQ